MLFLPLQRRETEKNKTNFHLHQHFFLAFAQFVRNVYPPPCPPAQFLKKVKIFAFGNDGETIKPVLFSVWGKHKFWGERNFSTVWISFFFQSKPPDPTEAFANVYFGGEKQGVLFKK